ncbi:MAG TPA: tRNA lysidine(34) synthetase TilS [Candidatus Moranbacteria bacterium]|nr:tRNA lysidine(34) synthetase TilS [Candidatus Moranbacteria bacterium]
MTNLIKKVQETIFQYKLFGYGSRIILGISGGPDSVALLHIFSKLQKKYALELIIVHVNYGLRGQDSQLDERIVRELAKKYGFKIFVKKVTTSDITLQGKNKKDFSEQNLRYIRYTFFEKIRKENNFDFMALAHNLDDQVETYLMRVIRGSGLVGLSAMLFKNKKIIRPLLNVPRSRILIYLKKNNLKWRLDKTNLETKFLRNKIRHQFIPYLEKNFNPNIRKTIFQATLSIAQDENLLSALTQEIYPNSKTLKISWLKQLHPALQKRVLRKAITKVKTNLRDVEASHIYEIIKIIESQKGKSQKVILKELKISRKGDNLNIEKI